MIRQNLPPANTVLQVFNIHQSFPHQNPSYLNSPKFYPARILRYTVYVFKSHCQLLTAFQKIAVTK